MNEAERPDLLEPDQVRDIVAAAVVTALNAIDEGWGFGRAEELGIEAGERALSRATKEQPSAATGEVTNG